MYMSAQPYPFRLLINARPRGSTGSVTRIKLCHDANLIKPALSEEHILLQREADSCEDTMEFLYVPLLLLVLIPSFFTGTTAQLSNRQLISKYKTNQQTYERLQDDVKRGTIKALDTCREIFKKEQWDCDVNKNKLLDHKGKELPAFAMKSLPANKEGAYLQALGSASVMYTLTSNCRLGNYKDCACVPIDRPFANDQKWRWSGCNENLNFGETMTKYFIDNLERRANDRRREALNLHNNEIGRKVVRSAARKACRCHGPTASCAYKTCSRQLVNFTEVGKRLKEKYDNAVRVKFVNNTIKPYHDTGLPLATGRTGDLAYFDISPDYCQPDKKTGYPGMRKRTCIHGNDGAHHCKRMCKSCGLKFRNDVEVKSEKCRCDFVWCCKVTCDICEKVQDRTICL